MNVNPADREGFDYFSYRAWFKYPVLWLREFPWSEQAREVVLFALVEAFYHAGLSSLYLSQLG